MRSKKNAILTPKLGKKTRLRHKDSMAEQIMFTQDNRDRIHAVENSFGPKGKPLSKPVGSSVEEKQMRCSPREMIFCFLFQRPFRMMLPYTSTSLKRKKTLGCGPRRLSFISRPSPIRTRPGLDKGFPFGPNEFSTAWIRSRHTASCGDASQVDGSSHFKLLGGAFTGSLLKLAPVDVGDEAIDLHLKHAVPLRDHCPTTCGGREKDRGTNILQIAPHLPLVLGLDLEDLHFPLLPSVQPLGFLAAPLVLLGPGVAQDHRLVLQHVLYLTVRVLPNAVLQEGLGEGLGFSPIQRLEKEGCGQRCQISFTRSWGILARTSASVEQDKQDYCYTPDLSNWPRMQEVLLGQRRPRQPASNTHEKS
ncbi:hypothetical protein FQN60_004390 [Etheostoma spectabile]|uniref:Uncharacterized protein n=1 Tax=Etheostoma spectabile TaxID=54343 RepID=A0A5J5CYC6_9PERO|nr:hypothetical protein FQN60_004390 [Etheostoma spectabile]